MCHGFDGKKALPTEGRSSFSLEFFEPRTILYLLIERLLVNLNRTDVERMQRPGETG